MRRVAIALLVGIALLVTRPTAVRADGDVDYAGFKTILLDQLGSKLDATIAEYEGKVANASDAARPSLQRAVKELKLMKKRLEDVNTVDALWESVQDAKEAMGGIAEEANKAWGGTAHLGQIAAEKTFGLAEATEKLGDGIEYAIKLKKLGEDLDAVSQSTLSPSTKKLAIAMTTMSALLSEFGEHAPLVGQILKGYGDLTAELLKATTALDAKIEAREGDQLITGVHGDRGAMLDGLNAIGIPEAQRIDGLRDAFEYQGKIVIWDKTTRAWIIATEVEPGLTPDELVERYLFLAKRGVKEASIEQVLKGFHRTIVLELTPSSDHVAPGRPITLKVTGTLASSKGPIAGKELYAVVKLANHTGIGEGELSGAERVKIGESVTWTAPNNLNETYQFTAELHPDTAQVALAAGSGTATVRTGSETRIELTGPHETAAGMPLQLTTQLLTIDGVALPPNVAGAIELTFDPPLGYIQDQVERQDSKGTVTSWRAPDHAVTKITVTARYTGATSYGLFDNHTAGAVATHEIVVGAPLIDAGVDAIDAPPDSPPDAAEPTPDAAEAAPIDAGVENTWPGTWVGVMKSTGNIDGTSATTDQKVTLKVKLDAAGDPVVSADGFPSINLKRTPSNPLAANATVELPNPGVSAQLKSFKGQTKWVAFLRDGKLHIAVHITIDQTVEVQNKVQQSHSEIDAIGILERK